MSEATDGGYTLDVPSTQDHWEAVCSLCGYKSEAFTLVVVHVRKEHPEEIVNILGVLRTNATFLPCGKPHGGKGA